MIIKEPLTAAVDSFVQFLETYCHDNNTTVHIREINNVIDGVPICTIYVTPYDSIASMAFDKPFDFSYDGVVVNVDTTIVNKVNISRIVFLDINNKKLLN